MARATPPSRKKNRPEQPDASAPAPPPAAPVSRIHTVPAWRSFMDDVAGGILRAAGGDPLKLSDYTVLVPDRAAEEALREAFMTACAGAPMVLPRIRIPDDIDDEDLSLRISDHRILSGMLMDIPPAVSRLTRQMVLAGEILKMPGIASSPQKAVALGGELGRLIDAARQNGVELDNVDALVPPEFGAQWKRTAEFLKIVTETWPAWLEKNGLIDPEDHKNAVIHVQAAHWRANPPASPVIAAGFTSASPAVLALLEAVAGMQQGAVILPDADRDLDGADWAALGPAHPQYEIKKILAALKTDRAAVRDWEQAEPAPAQAARRVLLREAMRPGGAREKAPAAALQGFSLSVCGTPQEEASIIALALRRALEKPGRTAALVTEDRSLARRVSARLRYWNVHVEDSAGVSLADTSAGAYLAATAQMAAEELAPVPFLEALKHPLAALGGDRAAFRDTLMHVEERALHGPRPAPGTSGLRLRLSAAFNRAAAHKPEAAAEKTAVDGWLARLDAAGADFFARMAGEKPQPFGALLDAHIRFAETLAATDAESGAARLWRGADGRAAARFLGELRGAAAQMPAVTGRDYADTLQGLMRGAKVHTDAERHPALRILTPEQAQFVRADTLVLGGLNADVWPRRADENPWLSPAMTDALGLPDPAEGAGRAAHRFVRLAARGETLLTRAERTGDAPAVASPLVTRLHMALRRAGLENDAGGNARLREINAAMHTPATVMPAEPPAPAPPKDRRPRQLPVTAVETLMRDPYAVYARYVLKLKAKAPIDAAPNAAERGTLTHAALDAFVKKYPDTLPGNAYEELLKIGEEVFSQRLGNPTVQSFWWPRFERVAGWFVKFEAERRETSRTLGTEVQGRLEIDLGDGEIFTLTAVADRIDRNADGGLEIIDYKTGAVPSQKSVALGFSPQLTLEAAIAFSGGMAGIGAGDVGSLQYWKLSGGRPAGAVTAVRGDAAALAEEARRGVTALARAFNDPKTPYRAAPRPAWAPRYDYYSHLSRAGAWDVARKTRPQKRKPRTARGGGRKPK